jgi:hypothetical protein
MMLVASVLTGVATASAREVQPSGSAHFNNPRSANPAAHRRLGDLIIRRLNLSRRGEVDRTALYSIDDKGVVDAQLRAHRRGVAMKDLEDHHYNNPQWNRLVNHFGTNRHHSSWARHCVGACRGHGTTTTLHSKLYLFERGFTVGLGSANMTGNGFQNQYNDLFITQNKALYVKFVRYFSSLAADRPSPCYSFGTPGFRVQIYPCKVTRSNDPQMRALQGIRCKGSARGYGWHGRTVVRLNMHAITGTRGRYLAREMRSLWSHGCNVRIIGGDSIGTVAKRILAPVPHKWAREGRPYTHLKVLTVNGRYGRDRSAKLVWTGSENWADGINNRDEIEMRINIPHVVDAYARWFADMWGVYRK